MALKIRLRPQGRNNRAFYRVVVTDSRNPSDGKYVEALGWYDPMAAEDKALELDAERVRHWLALGAQLTERTEALVARAAPEVIKDRTAKAVAKRAKERQKRKARNSKKTAAPKATASKAAPKAKAAKTTKAKAAKAE